MRFSTVLAASLALVPTVLLSQAQSPNNTNTLTIETMALMTDITPANLYENDTYNQSTFILDAVLAMKATLSALLTYDETVLTLCNGTDINDQTSYMPNCDQVSNNGSLIAQVVFDYASTLDLLSAVNNNSAFSTMLPLAIENLTAQIITMNGTAGCARVFDETLEESLFALSLVLVAKTNETSPSIHTETTEYAFFSTNYTYVQETCEYANYASYLVNITAPSSGSASTASASSTSGAISTSFSGSLLAASLIFGYILL